MHCEDAAAWGLLALFRSRTADFEIIFLFSSAKKEQLNMEDPEGEGIARDTGKFC